MNGYPLPPVKQTPTGWIVTVILLCVLGLPFAGFVGALLGYSVGVDEYKPKVSSLEARLQEIQDQQPKALNYTERSKITGRAGPETTYGKKVFSGSLYNGSDTPLSAVVIELTCQDSDDKDISKREYRVQVDMNAKSTSAFSIDIYDEGKEIAHVAWNIKEAYSRPENKTPKE